MGRKPFPRRSVFYSPEGSADAAARAEAHAPQRSVEPVAGAPSLSDVVSGLRDGDVLIVRTLADLGPSLANILTTLNGLARRGVRLRSLAEGLDTGSESAPHVVSGLRIAAELQERRERGRWRDDVEAARGRGAFRPGRPRGLSLAAVAELRGQGLGAAEIAQRLGVSRWSVYRRLKELGEGA